MKLKDRALLVVSIILAPHINAGTAITASVVMLILVIADHWFDQ